MRCSSRLIGWLILGATMSFTPGCKPATPPPAPVPTPSAAPPPSSSSVPLDQILREQRDRIPPAALERAFAYLREHPSKVTNARYVTVIDFDQPSTARRMHVIDTTTGKVEDLLVAHAKKSGENFATQFSNTPGSNMSSLGLYLTGDAITSPKHGPAMLLHGQEATNDNALKREIIFHGADYVSDEFIRKNGRLGRSLGCPAVEYGVVARLVDELKGGSVMVTHRSETLPTTQPVVAADGRAPSPPAWIRHWSRPTGLPLTGALRPSFPVEVPNLTAAPEAPWEYAGIVRRCLDYKQPSEFVVPHLRGHFPPPWEELNPTSRLSGLGRTQAYGPVLFMHGRRTPGGRELLAVVTWRQYSEPTGIWVTLLELDLTDRRARREASAPAVWGDAMFARDVRRPDRPSPGGLTFFAGQPNPSDPTRWTIAYTVTHTAFSAPERGSIEMHIDGEPELKTSASLLPARGELPIGVAVKRPDGTNWAN
jgi:hypothetical protein